MNFDPVIYSIPIFFTLIGVELAYDWYRVRKKFGESVYHLKDALNNIGCGVIDQITAVFTKVFTLGTYTLAFEWSRSFISYEIPSNWLWFIVFFIVVDFFYYLAHRWSHAVNFMWLGHVVHHQSEDYNLSVALRQGAVQKLMTFWVYIPLAIVGFPPQWMLVTMGFNLLYQFWIHTELIDKMGWFELLFNTPSHHRVHHGKNPKYIDKNHAGVLILWDRMLGTFQAEEERPTYGITNPTLTFNSVWSHIQPFSRMSEGIKKMDGLSNKINYLIQSPGWTPKNQDAVVQEYSLDEPKFDIALSQRKQIYILVQFVINMAIGAYYLNNLDLLNMVERISLLSHTILYLSTLGYMMDDGKSSVKWEVFRHLINLGISLLFLLHYDNLFIAIFVFGYAMLSLIWFLGFVIKRK